MDDPLAKLVLGVDWYVVFLFSIVCHEAAHALAAMKLGDLTAYHNGQVTLDPIPHIRHEPFGTVIVPLISFVLGGWMLGWASAPYDPFWANRYPRRAALMAAAGPLANLLLVLVAALVIHVGIFCGIFEAPAEIRDFSDVVGATSDGIARAAATLVSIMFSLNLLLCVFNLLPLPPLDGSSVIGLFMSEQSALRVQEFMRQPGFSFIGLLVAWKLFGPLFAPIHGLAINLLYPGQYEAV